MVVGALRVQINQSIRRQMIYAQCHGVTAVTSHRVFDAVGFCGSGLNAEKWVIGHSAFVHAIESQLVVVATPKHSFADTKFIAMHALTVNNAIATIFCDLDFA